ncbi:hypothetical protein [Effusibacillus lacus]|uniref:Uncharacterized protein n=1 Tax=Effusibacillus lacus TaxID=1348429 RepID=A0A292YTJ0_9BACL|nr:hypothetical protein [Effusibacillus lacus]TCS73711.1 hypothetical protein EDD64_11611 [Effusibacillus lacus]GAX92073.1 hypothetical protein EFBL_3764 [Effusibacillus lacus]
MINTREEQLVKELREIHKQDQDAVHKNSNPPFNFETIGFIARKYSKFTVQDIMDRGRAERYSNIFNGSFKIPLEVKPMWYPSKEAQKRISDLLDTLKGTDREDFYQDVLKASYEAISQNSIKPLVETLESWDATAEILLDQETMDDIKAAEEQFARGEGILWDPKNFD